MTSVNCVATALAIAAAWSGSWSVTLMFSSSVSSGFEALILRASSSR